MMDTDDVVELAKLVAFYLVFVATTCVVAYPIAYGLTAIMSEDAAAQTGAVSSFLLCTCMTLCVMYIRARRREESS